MVLGDYNKRKCDEYEELLCDRVDIPEEPAKRQVVPNSVYRAVYTELQEIEDRLRQARLNVGYLETTYDEMKAWLDSVEMEDDDYE